MTHNMRTTYFYFGETRWVSGTLPTDRLFTGQRELGGLGLYDYNARMYSPSLGRFISADSIVPRAGDAQAFNRYAYARNSPMLRADPSGHGDCNIHIERCLPDDAALSYPLSQLTIVNFYRYFAKTTTKSHFYVAPQHQERHEAAAYEYKVNTPQMPIPLPKLGPPSPVKSGEVYDFLRSAPKPFGTSQRQGAAGSCLMSFNCDYHVFSAATGPIGPIVNIYLTSQGLFMSTGVNVGAKGVSVSFFSGDIQDGVQVEKFLKGRSVSISGGVIFGGAHTWSIDTGQSIEAGFYLLGGFGLAQTITVLHVGPSGIVFGP